MSLKSRAQQLKADIPALFLALNSPDTPALARILAALTIRLIPRPVTPAAGRLRACGKTGNPSAGIMHCQAWSYEC